jgi:serine/threonine protein kinase
LWNGKEATLIDFGHATYDPIKIFGLVDAATYGTTGYRAPEVEKHDQTYARDLWSLGVTILVWVINFISRSSLFERFSK